MNGSYDGSRVSYGNHIRIKFQLAGQDIAGNFSLVNWQAYAVFYGSDSQLDNAYVNTNVGQVFANGGRVKNYQGTHTTREHHIASGTVRINHRDDGNAEFQIGGGITFYGMGRSEGTSPVYALPRIPRQSNPTFSKNLYTLGERIVVNMNRKAGFTHRGSVQIPDGNIIKEFRDQTDAWGWTPDENEIDEIYRRMPNTLKTTLGVDITTWNGGTQIGGVGWQNVEIQLNPEIIRPEFSNFGISDTNAVATSITGSREILIQGISNLRAWISPADKMLAKKFATPSHYIFEFDGSSVQKAFSNTETVQHDFEKKPSETGNLSVRILAVDSRGLQTVATKNLQVLPYSPPAVQISAKRQNNFDETSEIEIRGNYSDFSNKNPIQQVRWRWRENGGAWQNWANLAVSQNGGNFSISKIYKNFAQTSIVDIEVEARDKFNTTTATAQIERGKPIVFISSNKEKVGVNKVPEFGDLDVAGDVYSQGKKVLTESDKPKRVAFEIVKNGGRWQGQVVAGYTAANLVYDQITLNTGGFTHQDGVVKVPEDGIYQLFATTFNGDVPKSIALVFQIWRNGQWEWLNAEEYKNTANGVERGVNASTITYIPKGIGVRCQIFNFANGDPTRYGSRADWAKQRFMIVKIA